MELCWRFGRFHFKKTCKTIRNFGVLWTQSKVQVVAVDWILSFRIKCVGLKVILGVISVVGGGAVLDILDGH